MKRKGGARYRRGGLCRLLPLLLWSIWLTAPVEAAAQRPDAPSTVRATEVSATTTDVDAFITSVMEEWELPGLAVAVVKDGEIVLNRGYGFRDLEAQLPVSPRTLFAIGSITKSFTVTLLGMLEEEGYFDWDEPLRRHLPDFELADEVATLRLTPRDLVTQRSGLPRHDLVWYGSGLTRNELYERLRYLEPSEDLRAAFQYQNLMFMTAGYLAEQLTGITWEALVEERILIPLGMSRSNFSVTRMQQTEDFATPYDADGEVVREIDFRNIDAIGPAGSINSSVEEMIRYVRLHMDLGEQGGERLLSRATAEAMQSPHMVVPGAVPYDELGHTAYGMGFFITTYRGRKLVHHGGGIDGFISLLSFMPREKLGMIVLTNLSGENPVPTIVTRGLYDRFLGLEPVDWVGRVKESRASAEDAEDKRAEEAGPVEDTEPSHALEDYVGDYEHPAYGTIAVTLDGDHLTATYHGVTATLDHYHYDVFELAEDPSLPFGGMKILFRYRKDGRIDELLAPLEPAIGDILFVRLPDAHMTERAFLEPFTGEYAIGDRTLSVALRGTDTLTLTVPGQPTYVLVPRQDTTFDIDGLPGYSVEFRLDGEGAATAIVMHQPNRTLVAERKDE